MFVIGLRLLSFGRSVSSLFLFPALFQRCEAPHDTFFYPHRLIVHLSPDRIGMSRRKSADGEPATLNQLRIGKRQRSKFAIGENFLNCDRSPICNQFDFDLVSGGSRISGIDGTMVVKCAAPTSPVPSRAMAFTGYSPSGKAAFRSS